MVFELYLNKAVKKFKTDTGVEEWGTMPCLKTKLQNN